MLDALAYVAISGKPGLSPQREGLLEMSRFLMGGVWRTTLANRAPQRQHHRQLTIRESSDSGKSDSMNLGGLEEAAAAVTAALGSRMQSEPLGGHGLTP
jgi:hypothetical protein